MRGFLKLSNIQIRMMIDGSNNGYAFSNNQGGQPTSQGPAYATLQQHSVNPSGHVSARSSNKRQPRLFINVNQNHSKKQPLIGSGGGGMNAASSSGGVGGMVPSTTMLMNGLLYDPSLSDQQRWKGGPSQATLNTTTASNGQIPSLQPHLATSADSRGNQSTSSNNGRSNNGAGVQVINRKFIHFAGGNTNAPQTSRAVTHSQKRQNNLVGILPLANLNPHTEQSPGEHQPSSGRSGKSGGGLAEMLQNPRGPINGRMSKRRSNGGMKIPGSNAVSAPHHQLGYRRHQIMDITEDSNTNSKNKLTLGSGYEETMNSQESEREQPYQILAGGGGPAYNFFYHASGSNSLNAVNPGSSATGGDQLNRFNSKKSLTMKNQQSKLDTVSPYSTNTQALNHQQQQFQFTRKQTLMNAENSLSATRDPNTTQSGVKLIKLKKPQPIKISMHRESLQQPAPQLQVMVPQIGKRRPLIIRKNNYISQGNGNSNERGSQKDNSEISPFNKTSNFNTLISGQHIAGGRLNNTNSFVGLGSEGSLSHTQTTAQIKNQTGSITQMLKSLNATQQSNEGLGKPQFQMNPVSLKDSKLIKVNLSKKRLDTARKSRLTQIQPKEAAQTTGNLINNSLSQQPESRQPNPLSLMMKKKRSLLLPKAKNTAEVENNTQSSNGGGSFIVNQPNERESRRDTQRQYITNIIDQQLPQTQRQGGPKLPAKSEERTITHDSSAQMIQQQKVLSRGQMMRLQKQKQQYMVNPDSNSAQRNSTTDQNSKERSPNHEVVGSAQSKVLNPQKSTGSLLGSGSKEEGSLARVESKKDLTLNPAPSGGGNLEKHFVKEELIIFENLNDSSGTPGDFQFMQHVNNKTTSNQNTIQISEGRMMLNQPSITDESKESSEAKRDSIKSGGVNNTYVSFGTGQEASKPIVAESKPPKEPEVTLIPIVEEDVTQDTSNNQQRLLNSSIQMVKSPIGTTTSFKSQNSQQAGPNHDELIFPMRPGKALKLFLNQLTDYERGEILDYQEIYFLGLTSAKVHGNPKEEHNYGYDDDKGDYKVIVKDQIGYRYEVLQFIGKGSFGTALKVFDHKTKEEVALKIVKNKKKYAYQAGIELKILNFLKENDPDDIMNVVHMKDYVIFRKHLCITFELLSMNLFEFLKINDFNGFDHNLIRRFAIQLLYALKYLKEFGIIHCDLKPENILLKEANKSGIKIIDFGSSTFLDERVYTYIQSRFYRAPEIMLGIPYTCAIDMWSFGCIMAELYIGYPIFPGESENDQMSRIIEMIDKPSQAVYSISQRRAKFFTETPSTGDYEPVMLKNSRGKLRKPGGKPLSLLLGDEDPDFLDFVQKCLEWDPEKRMSPDDALRHIWILKGLPPQVLVHHQRMHNIATPELPESVREARDQFFLEMTLQQESLGIAQNTSQLGGNGGAANRQTGKSQQQQSMNPQQRTSHQTGGGAAATTIVKATVANKQQTSNIKAETIKSLERAQLKNQLHQLNSQKVQQQMMGKSGGKVQMQPPQFPQGLNLKSIQDSNRSDQPMIGGLTSTTNTARIVQQQTVGQSINSNTSPTKQGLGESGPMVVGFKRRNHMAAARHQRNMNIVQRGQEAVTH